MPGETAKARTRATRSARRAAWTATTPQADLVAGARTTPLGSIEDEAEERAASARKWAAADPPGNGADHDPSACSTRSSPLLPVLPQTRWIPASSAAGSALAPAQGRRCVVSTVVVAPARSPPPRDIDRVTWTDVAAATSGGRRRSRRSGPLPARWSWTSPPAAAIVPGSASSRASALLVRPRADRPRQVPVGAGRTPEVIARATAASGRSAAAVEQAPPRLVGRAQGCRPRRTRPHGPELQHHQPPAGAGDAVDELAQPRRGIGQVAARTSERAAPPGHAVEGRVGERQARAVAVAHSSVRSVPVAHRARAYASMFQLLGVVWRGRRPQGAPPRRAARGPGTPCAHAWRRRRGPAPPLRRHNARGHPADVAVLSEREVAPASSTISATSQARPSNVSTCTWRDAVEHRLHQRGVDAWQVADHRVPPSARVAGRRIAATIPPVVIAFASLATPVGEVAVRRLSASDGSTR